MHRVKRDGGGSMLCRIVDNRKREVKDKGKRVTIGKRARGLSVGQVVQKSICCGSKMNYPHVCCG